MIKFKFLSLKYFVLVLVFNTSLAADNSIETAAAFYLKENWSAAIKAYTLVVKDQPNNEQAWYRMAQAYIHLLQGEEALQANEHLSKAKQIPSAAVLYQKAQALNINGMQQPMWDTLHLAADAGLVNIKDLQDNPMWAKYKNKDQFSALKLKVDKNNRPCMYDSKYRAFDFWLGHWEVYGNREKSGPLLGHNTITRTEHGCLIMEQWQGASGSTGTSMNYYDGIIDRWVQRWVSNGTVIDYSGGLIKVSENKQAMELVGKIFYASANQQPQIRDFRGSWSPLDDGVVQQLFEESIDGGKTWNVWFNGYYFRLNDEAKNAQ